MATNFPGSLDSFTNPTSGSTLDSPSHASQHANINDAVEALEAKVGVDGSSVTTSLDYKVAQQGLTLVKSQTIGSGVSSVTVTGAFSATFDSYRIVAHVTSASSATGLMRLGTTTTGYYWGHVNVNLSGTVFGLGANNDVQWEEVTVFRTNGCSLVVDLHRPYLAARTTINSSGSDIATSGSPLRVMGGFLDNTTSYTSFQFYPRTGTMTGGTIRVYGYNNG